MDNFDVVVIGAGPAGYECASLLAKQGKNVAIIEKCEEKIGGTCLNEGCVPAKQYLESALYIAKKSYFESCGVHVDSMSLDINKLRDKKDNLIDQLRAGISTKLKKAKVITIFGEATFEDEKSIKVNDEIITADKFVIASGSVHRPHPLLEIDGKQIISSREVFKLDRIPSSILIVGGGAIGCEFATFFNSLGVSVDIAEFTPQIVPAEDVDVAKALQRELQKKGINITVEANVISFVKNKDSVTIKMDTKKGEVEKEYELVLVSIGRAPNTKDLNLEKANIKSNRGFIAVKQELLTSNTNVYAIGDVISTPALAHSAYNEAKVVANNICGITCKPSKVIPFVTFCQPQVASVGKNEKSLKAEGIEYETIKHFYKSSAKAKIKGDDAGFIKLLCEKKSGTILGGVMIGNDTTENIHQILLCIEAKLTKKDISKMVFAHPTLSESLWEMT